MSYRETPRGYLASLLIVAVLAVGFAIDASLGGARAHLLGWLLATAILVGADLLVTYAARSTRTITLTADALTVGDDSVARADIVGADSEIDPALPVLGMSLTRDLPRRTPGLTLALADGTGVVVPTRRPDRLTAALGLDRGSVDIRPATPADLELLDEIDDRADTVFRIAGYDLPDLEPFPSEPVQVFVAGTPAFGFVQIDEVDGLAHIQEVAVVPGRMRRGVGTALVEAACAWAREHGYAAITLTTFAEVPWNGPFYTRLGFRVVPEGELGPRLAARRAHERPIEVVGPRVAMRRDL
ncbi:MAG: GNAT family N-acetyltransferase [Jatrophihabitans sp.]|uniref:GNAT family N-acetyltransferase n=1 Tax=Jatrophihabitans sp. TaxID=1932789 RepID=UPI003F7E29B4